MRLFFSGCQSFIAADRDFFGYSAVRLLILPCLVNSIPSPHDGMLPGRCLITVPRLPSFALFSCSKISTYDRWAPISNTLSLGCQFFLPFPVLRFPRKSCLRPHFDSRCSRASFEVSRGRHSGLDIIIGTFPPSWWREWYFFLVFPFDD